MTPGGSVALCCVKMCYSFNKNNLFKNHQCITSVSTKKHILNEINTITIVSTPLPVLVI